MKDGFELPGLGRKENEVANHEQCSGMSKSYESHLHPMCALHHDTEFRQRLHREQGTEFHGFDHTNRTFNQPIP